MVRKILIATSLLVSMIFIATCSLVKTPQQYSYIGSDGGNPNCIPMPIVTDDPYSHLAWGGAPKEQRDEQFRRWLAVSLKISVSNASGSGTIVYFDSKDGYAYVQSCGHLWNGAMTAEEGKTRKLMCKVITWYHNEKKLDTPKDYPAEVIYYSNVRGKDCSLLRFKPDWVPTYIPIAPAEFKYQENAYYHSCGCDGGRECAHYDVRFIGMRGDDVTTTENSPRPGRSGGGLMTDTQYIGICWGTTDVSGNGNGFFTPLSVLREYNQKNGYGWLNEVGINWARQIPIRDHADPNKKFPPDYIPLPDGR